MPLFWFVSFANRIKRIRDKTFFFIVRLRPNPHTRHTSRIHRAGCNSGELRGIHMSEVPPLLLEKQVTTGSLSRNLFCHLQVNGKWLIILESLKKKKRKQIRVLLWANPINNKRIRSLWCPSGALASNFFEWLSPLAFFASFSTFSGKALASSWPWSLSLSLSLPFSTMPACSIPEGWYARVISIVGPTRGGENSLRSRYIWGGIFYFLLRDEKLAKE